MGQSLLKLTPGSEVNKSKIGEIANEYYEKHFSAERLKELDDHISRDSNLVNNEKLKNNFKLSHFYRGVCEVVEEINISVGNTQFRVPKEKTLQATYDKHHKGKTTPLSKEEFQRILQDAIMETGFTGIGAKDVILYIFGVPATALLIKKGVLPRSIPNELFIPAVTSATVLALSKFNKI